MTEQNGGDQHGADRHGADWREHGVRVVRGDQLDTNTPQTPA